jgi:hypothetical protein
MNDAERAPIDFLLAMLESYGRGCDLNFSRYVIGPPGSQYVQPRETVRIHASEFGRAWLEHQIRTLAANQELALNSCVMFEERPLHVPMIDFAESVSQAEAGRVAEQFAQALSVGALWCFSSGRSFHAYGDRLLEPGEWHAYLGALLTLSPNVPVVDVRWVGHSLRRGYSALRWSHRTSRYQWAPILIGKVDVSSYRVAVAKRAHQSKP